MSDLISRLQRALEGRYSVERELGRGGMAAVFLARDLRHDRPVALKVLHPDLAQSVGTDRFEREIRFAARLQHPHILPVHDSGDVPAGGPNQPHLLWFTMPYVDGESLRERINRERQLPLADAVRIAGEVADALEYAHQQGVIHRDIKPENILLKGSHALVADFGVARAVTPGSGEHAGITGTGLAVGTPAYMSPEQATGSHEIDARSDLYSLGTVLYEMLAGEPPFSGPTPQVILSRLLTEEPRALHTVRASVPLPVERVITTAIARAPADRFASAADFGLALQAAAVSGSTTAPVAPPALTRRRPRVTLALSLLVGFILGLGVLFAWRQRQNGAGAGDAGGVLLAVLPFENLGDSGDAYFADGVTDEVRGKLSSVPGFQVIARASSSQYRGNAKPLRTVAQELGVRYLLTGTVRWVKAGGESRVQVRPELVEVVRSGATVGRWEKAFDASLTDVFQVQADIAGQVVTELKGKLAQAAAPGLGEAPTKNLAAYDEFLRGEQAYFGSSGPIALNQALERYGRAVALDSSFARAWVRLAMVRASVYSAMDKSHATAEAARLAAERVVALAPRLPEAYLALGNYFTLVRNDYASAIDTYAKGLKLAPAHPELLAALGLAEQGMIRPDSALAHMRRGLALDPRSLLYTRRLIRLLTYTRRYDEAAALVQQARTLAANDVATILYDGWLRMARGDLDGARTVIRNAPRGADEETVLAFLGFEPSFMALMDDRQQQVILRAGLQPYAGNRGSWGAGLATMLLIRGDRVRARLYADSALAFLEQQVRDNPDEPGNHAELAWNLALLGRKADAIRESELSVASRIKDGYQGPGLRLQLARIYQELGEPEKAMAQYREMLRIPSFVSAGWLRADPLLAALRQHPGFKALLAEADRITRQPGV